MEDPEGSGRKPDQKYLIVIGGSKALGAAINEIFGAENPVQRCRHHKLENVGGDLPEELKDQVKAAMRAAFRLPAKEGMARLEKQAQWLGHANSRAADPLRAGPGQLFTGERFGLLPGLARCPGS